MKPFDHIGLSQQWGRLVPSRVAGLQAGWERGARAKAMRATGLTFIAIGQKFGVTPVRARQIVMRAERQERAGRLSPVEDYLSPTSLAAGIAEIAAFGRKRGYGPFRPPSRLTHTITAA